MQMKEWLNARTYEYKQAAAEQLIARNWIDIPDGAQLLSTDGNGDGLIFWKDDFNLVIGLDDHWDKVYQSFSSFYSEHPRCKILWKRQTQPEELPFIDDEPRSLNDQYAEIEQVRQSIKVKSGSDSDHAADAMSYGIMGLIADTNHARQQSIEATLKERQSTYGSFEDVAFVTENIMSVLAQARVNGLNDLPHTHRMALYMIASKMARIVNGDFNHVDGWHDIAGYAKLVEDTI